MLIIVQRAGGAGKDRPLALPRPAVGRTRQVGTKVKLNLEITFNCYLVFTTFNLKT